ncbi:MAG: YggS family pyridoxal phosphate-dependent enzyme [Clostridia bacterium]|nr:YggS family pyridoxal phosphate-dependent enzyme [Clostridia bacterium]
MSIAGNLEIIKKNIEISCSESGRKPEEVKIIAVTKKRSPQEINEAISLGICDIGENRVQELMEKYDKVTEGVRWHLIGRLQTNKVKYIADKVYMIHSVDSIKLAEEINRRCEKIGKTMNILIEVNSGEENKGGIKYDEADVFIKEVACFKNLCVKGLMTMAPLGADEAQLKKVFSRLYNLSVDIAKKKYDNVFMEELSMGMSSDYTSAIREGATMIRPGRSLFE